MPSISFGDSTPSIYEDVLKPVSPIVRDYAFAGPLPNSNTVDPDAATPFEVRNSAYIASPVGHQHGQPVCVDEHNFGQAYVVDNRPFSFVLACRAH